MPCKHRRQAMGNCGRQHIFGLCEKKLRQCFVYRKSITNFAVAKNPNHQDNKIKIKKHTKHDYRTYQRR